MKNHLILGDWNALCDSCGRKFKASSLQKRWDGLIVCREDWEQRHPQDLLRVQREQISVPWSRPYPAQDTFIPVNYTDLEKEYLGIVETTAINFKKYIFNITIDASALNGASLNAYAINGTDNSTPIQTEAMTITEVFNITLGRYVNESMSLVETIAKRLYKNLSEAIPISESIRFVETEHTVESLSFSETRAFSIGKSFLETIALAETLAKKPSPVFADIVSISEAKTFTDNERTIESVGISETSKFAINKAASDSMTITESQSYSLVSPTSLNGSALNIYTLG